MIHFQGIVPLLGSHVEGRPHVVIGLSEKKFVFIPLHDFDEPEISDLDAAFAVQENIPGFDVAVHHTLVVGELESVANLGNDGGE